MLAMPEGNRLGGNAPPPSAASAEHPLPFVTACLLGSCIVLDHRLGSGSSGEAWLANLVDGKVPPPHIVASLPQTFAVKVIRASALQSSRHSDLVRDEIAALQALSHPYVVKYLCCWVEGADSSKMCGCLCIATEYCSGGDLRRLINRRKELQQYFTNEAIMWIAAQLLSGCAECHAKRIIHRDIKPANIFIRTAADGVLLGDFGLSRALDETNGIANSRVGTANYCSPQVAYGEAYTSKTDVWSVGVVLFECMTLQRPFFSATNTERQVFERILHEDPLPALRAMCEGKYSNTLINIVDACLSKREADRPTAVELLSTFSTTMANFVKANHIPLPVVNKKPPASPPAPRKSSPIPERGGSPLRGGGRVPASNAPPTSAGVPGHHHRGAGAVAPGPTPPAVTAASPTAAAPTSPIRSTAKTAEAKPVVGTAAKSTPPRSPTAEPASVAAVPATTPPPALGASTSSTSITKVSALLSSLITQQQQRQATPQEQVQRRATPSRVLGPSDEGHAVKTQSELLKALHLDEELFLLVKVLVLTRPARSGDRTHLEDGLFKLLVALRPEVDADKVIRILRTEGCCSGGG